MSLASEDRSLLRELIGDMLDEQRKQNELLEKLIALLSQPGKD